MQPEKAKMRFNAKRTFRGENRAFQTRRILNKNLVNRTCYGSKIETGLVFNSYDIVVGLKLSH